MASADKEAVEQPLAITEDWDQIIEDSSRTLAEIDEALEAANKEVGFRQRERGKLAGASSLNSETDEPIKQQLLAEGINPGERFEELDGVRAQIGLLNAKRATAEDVLWEVRSTSAKDRRSQGWTFSLQKLQNQTHGLRHELEGLQNQLHVLAIHGAHRADRSSGGIGPRQTTRKAPEGLSTGRVRHHAAIEHRTREEPTNFSSEYSTSIDGAFEDALDDKNLVQVMSLLENPVEVLASGSRPWITELIDLGYSKQEIGEVLLEEHDNCPWIYFDQWIFPTTTLDHFFHMQNCVHKKVGRLGSVNGPKLHTRPYFFSHDIRQATASICGLAGVVPHHQHSSELNGLAKFQYPSTASVSFYNIGDTASLTLDRIRTAVCGVESAAVYLQTTQAICSEFTIVCRGPGRPVVELQKIRLEDVVQFNRTLEGAQISDHLSIQNCGRLAGRILNSIPLSGPITAAAEAITATTEDILHVCALAAQTLSLGLLLFCQAHLAPFRPFYLAKEISTIDLLGISSVYGQRQQIRVEHQRMTCLDDAFRSPLLVFCLAGGPYVSAERCDMLADANGLIETWGTGSVSRLISQRRPGYVNAIFLCDGIVHNVGPNRCHWTKGTDTSRMSREWSLDASILIGAIMDTNKNCVQSAEQCLQKCQGYSDLLGTRISTWNQKTREFGAQGGQYGILTFNIGFIKDSGTTLKTKYLQDVQQRSNFLAFLESPCGLQVSFCSGLARRVSARQLLAELMPVYVQRKMKVPLLWNKLRVHFRLLETLVTDGMEHLIWQMSREEPRCLDLFLALVQEIMLSLQDTGLSSCSNNFAVALVPDDTREQIRRIDIDSRGCNYWTRALRDTASCATFAYFTRSCLQFGHLGCRNTEENWHRQILLLQTYVHLHFGGHKATQVPSPLALQHGQLYRLGRPDADVRNPLCARVLRPTPEEDPRLLVQSSAIPATVLRRLIGRESRHQHLQEVINPWDRAVRAFLTSSECLKFSFS